MSEELQKVPEQSKPQTTPGELTLADLMNLAGPLLKQWTDFENEKHKRELEYDTTVLQMLGRQISRTRFLCNGSHQARHQPRRRSFR